MNASENIIAHQVNCVGVYNSGVAKAIRLKYPKAFNEYKTLLNVTTSSNVKDLLGKVQFVSLEEGTDTFVANLFGQYNFGYDGKQYTEYIALRESLESLCLFARINDYSVALPYLLGSDRGGADWRIVEQIIMDVFDGYKVTLYKL